MIKVSIPTIIILKNDWFAQETIENISTETKWKPINDRDSW